MSKHHVVVLFQTVNRINVEETPVLFKRMELDITVQSTNGKVGTLTRDDRLIYHTTLEPNRQW